MDPEVRAREFLLGHTEEWLLTVSRVCAAVLHWVSASGEITSGEIGNISERLLAELTSPSLLTIIAGSEGREELVSAVMEGVSSQLAEVEAQPDSPDEWGEIVDIAGRPGDSHPRLVRQGDSWDYWDASPVLSEYQRKPYPVNQQELGDVIRLSLESEARVSRDFASVLRIDVIDIALYRALCAHPELLRTLHWRTFERLLADILATFGYEVELQRGTKDGGVDLFAIKKADPLGPQRFLLQAKRWKNAVGVDPVRQLAFLHQHYRVTKSCLATTAVFTRGAWELANQYRWQLELRDFEGLLEWVRGVTQLKTPGLKLT